MAISDNIDAKITAMDLERNVSPPGPTPVADEISEKAVKAILGGVQDWIIYMSLFKTSDAELAKLMPTAGTTQPERDLNMAKAYLVSNGVCGSGTGRHLKDNVTVRLD